MTERHPCSRTGETSGARPEDGRDRDVVIVGSSIAGVRTAQALRAEGHRGRILLVGQEETLPYDKPPLSKQFLTKNWTPDLITLLSAEDADRSSIDLRLGIAATGLDVAGHQVLLADGTHLGYDTVVIATGTSARPAPWRANSGLHVLRTLKDGEQLRRELQQSGPVVVIGGGFIGAEVAASARALGHDVTIIDPLASPMERIVGPELGRRLIDLHRRHGVHTRFGVGVEGVEGVAGDLTVWLTDGTSLSAATVVVGIGAVPNDGWLADSGLLVDNGVVCDEYCRAVGAIDVFAVGDVSRTLHIDHREHRRVEHWTNAVEQASCVAHNIEHPAELQPFRAVDYVWSDQFNWKVQSIGRPLLGCRYEIVGDMSADRPVAAALYAYESGQLTGAVTLNWPKGLARARRLINERSSLIEATAALGAMTAAAR